MRWGWIPRTVFARERRAFATIRAFEAISLMCHLKVSFLSKRTPNQRRYGRVGLSEIMTGPAVTEGVRPGDWSVLRREKWRSSYLSGAKVMPSAEPQSRASCRVLDRIWQLSERAEEIASKAPSSA
jgi:hypothetical protein